MTAPASRSLRIANSIVGGLFLVSAALQYNDPDPWRWIALYALAGIATLSWGTSPLSRVLTGLAAVFALAWALSMAPRVLPELVVRDLVRPMSEKTPAIEESREMLGLLMVGAWSAWLCLLSWRRRPSQRDA